MVKCIWCIHKWGCGSNVCDWAIGGTEWCHNQDEIICNLLFHQSNLCSLSDTILFLSRHTNPHCPFTAICRDIFPNYTYTPLCCTLVLGCTQQSRLPVLLLSLSSTVGSATSFILMFQCYGLEITIIPNYSLPHWREHWNRTKDSLGSWADHGIKRMGSLSCLGKKNCNFCL